MGCWMVLILADSSIFKRFRLSTKACRFPSRHAIGGHNASVGSRCGFAYGELFALPGPVGASDLLALVTGAKAASAAPVELPGQPPPPLA